MEDRCQEGVWHARFCRLMILALLVLLSVSGCASWHDERRSDAGYLSDGSTGGGWNTIESITGARNVAHSFN